MAKKNGISDFCLDYSLKMSMFAVETTIICYA